MLNRIRQRFGVHPLPLAALMLGMLPTTGCLLGHTHAVLKTRLPEVVLGATRDELLRQVDTRYAAIQSMTAFVQMSTSTGGALQGQVRESVSFSGNIILKNPDDIRVLLKVPLLGSAALDMVSNGKTFTMLIPRYNCAIVGSDFVTNTTQKGIYSLRPAVILDSMLIRGLQPGQIVSMTQDSRIVENPKKRKDLIQEPDYDLEFLSEAQNGVVRTLRVLHISRVDLLPYRQDIYNAEGKVETQAFYSNYQKFGDIDFPTKVVIQRPLDELGITIVIAPRTTFNQKMGAEEFDLGPIPASYATQNMDDPKVGAPTTPCAAHATQSPR